jgi:hypothetical protein
VLAGAFVDRDDRRLMVCLADLVRAASLDMKQTSTAAWSVTTGRRGGGSS